MVDTAVLYHRDVEYLSTEGLHLVSILTRISPYQLYLAVVMPSSMPVSYNKLISISLHDAILAWCLTFNKIFNSICISIKYKINYLTAEYEIGTPVPGTPCSFVVNTTIKRTGSILSPTYPGTYPKNLTCRYQFIGNSGQRIRLEFRDFDLFYGGPQ